MGTLRLIQCGLAEMPEKKAFNGLCECDFLLFRSAVVMHELPCLAILHIFLTVAWCR